MNYLRQAILCSAEMTERGHEVYALQIFRHCVDMCVS